MQPTASLSDLEKGALLPKTPVVNPVVYNGRRVQNLAPVIQANQDNPGRGDYIGAAICTTLCFAGFLAMTVIGFSKVGDLNFSFAGSLCMVLFGLMGIFGCGAVTVGVIAECCKARSG